MNPFLKKMSIGLLIVLPWISVAQTDTLSLTDLSAFRPQAGNWQIVGDLSMSPFSQPKEASAKGKKKKKTTEPNPSPYQVVAGTGILANLPSETLKDPLITSFEHGDILLEMDVMLPAGSNSGVYLQGRYEVQLLDSWGVKNPKFSDIGGIYRNWESDPATSYMGKAPMTNAAKAPGLWQTLKISFRAPKFDAAGNKIENARIQFAELNGVRIHENVEIPRPTGGPLANDEVAKGPLMIQGDHGAVAFRNIRYTMLSESQVTISDVQYQVALGEFGSLDELETAAITREGTLIELTYEVASASDDFGITFRGTISIPQADTYQFRSAFNGISRLVINGEQVLDGVWRPEGSVKLEAGTYPFTYTVIHYWSWISPILGLTVRTQSTHPKSFHTLSAYPPDGDATAPIYMTVGAETKMLRAFLDFEGDRSRRLTHTIGVGDPNGLHYVYDLQGGNLACVWKGDFVDATPMWHERGDGSFLPLGMIQYLFEGSSLGTPDGSDNKLISKGYALENGRPVFQFALGTATITDRVFPDEENKFFVRQISSSAPIAGGELVLAKAEKITQLADGTFVIGDKQYYLQVRSGGTPTIRNVGQTTELVVPLGSSPVSYSIIW